MRDDHGARPAACAALRRHATTRSWCGTPCRTTHRRVLLTAAARHHRGAPRSAWVQDDASSPPQPAGGNSGARARRADRLRLVPGRNWWPRPLLHEPRRRARASRSVRSEAIVMGPAAAPPPRSAWRVDPTIRLSGGCWRAARRGNHRRRRRRRPLRAVLAASRPLTGFGDGPWWSTFTGHGPTRAATRNMLGASPVRQTAGRTRGLPPCGTLCRPDRRIQAGPCRALRGSPWGS